MERVLISNVESSYGSKKVLRDINICAKQGECVGIVGANGSGKSTLLNILSGLRLKYKGNINIISVGNIAEAIKTCGLK